MIDSKIGITEEEAAGNYKAAMQIPLPERVKKYPHENEWVDAYYDALGNGILAAETLLEIFGNDPIERVYFEMKIQHMREDRDKITLNAVCGCGDIFNAYGYTECVTCVLLDEHF